MLALRRERYALGRLIRRLAATQRRMVELKVVQYGVTREKLAEIADTGDGWDVLHLSGHGTRGVFLLEHADGSPDEVAVADLVAMLRPARRRVKLAVVSACESAAAVTAQTLRLIGLDDQADQAEEQGDRSGEGSAGVAASLVDALDCAVVAMRYPVDDEFAVGFGRVLYEHVLGREQPVDVAVARALKDASGLSVATPGLFGPRAVGLTLPVPRGTPRLDPDDTPTAYLPPEPARFVGRAASMAAASTALASASGRTAVLLYGMAGAGKTSCALELAYRHQDGFAATAFWQAPDGEFTDALANLAVTLETQLGRYGFQMTGHLGSVQELAAFLPRLRQIMAERGVLLVLDNLETLLTAEGTWRDPRWDPLIAALNSHDGESRVIMTSRTAPTGLDGATLVLPVHALSLAEAVALARELPNLRGLLHAEDVPIRGPAGSTVAADRDRVRRVLRVVQGHPKLMELADAAAADTARLDAQLAAAEDEAGSLSLDAFFRDGDSALDPGQFLAALTAWTVSALDVLTPTARLMAQFIACLETVTAGPTSSMRPGGTCGSGWTSPVTRLCPGRFWMLWLLRRWSSRRTAPSCATGCIPVWPPRSAPLPARTSATPPTPNWPRTGTRPPGRRGRGRTGRTAAWWWWWRVWPPHRTCCVTPTGTPPPACSTAHSRGTSRRGWWWRRCPRCAASPLRPAPPGIGSCWPVPAVCGAGRGRAAAARNAGGRRRGRGLPARLRHRRRPGEPAAQGRAAGRGAGGGRAEGQ